MEGDKNKYKTKEKEKHRVVFSVCGAEQYLIINK